MDLYLADPNTGAAAMVKTDGKYRINLFSSDAVPAVGVTVFVETVITDIKDKQKGGRKFGVIPH